MRTCTICSRPDRPEIDAAIVGGESLRGLAARYATSAQTLLRHKPHVSAALSTAKAAEQAASADTLLDQVQRLQRSSLRILRKAEKAGDLRTSCAAISQARGCLELLGKVTAQIVEHQHVNLDIDVTKLSDAELAAIIKGHR